MTRTSLLEYLSSNRRPSTGASHFTIISAIRRSNREKWSKHAALHVSHLSNCSRVGRSGTWILWVIMNCIEK
jgi:hypothetical protein